MKSIIRFTLLLCAIGLVLGVYSFTLINAPNAESRIAGSWSEKDWKYEKVYRPDDKKQLASQNVSDVVAWSGNRPKIHAAEEWTFLDNRTLLLQKDDKTDSALWRIKGRGNVLEILYPEGHKERYTIEELSASKLVLTFDYDIQVKGLTSLTFEKM